MTPAEAYALAPVLLAYGKGEVVQYRYRLGRPGLPEPQWHDYTPQDGRACSFCDPQLEWRLKPSPQEWWLVVAPNGTAVEVFHTPDAAASLGRMQPSWKLVHVMEAPL